MATTASKLHTTGLLTVRRTPPPSPTTASTVKASLSLFPKSSSSNSSLRLCHLLPNRLRVSCKATEVSSSSSQAEEAPTVLKDNNENWVPVVPLVALPKGERRLIIQDGETILLLWYKDEIFAIENKSPAEGAYTEGLLNAKLTQVSPFFFFNCVLYYVYSVKEMGLFMSFELYQTWLMDFVCLKIQEW